MYRFFFFICSWNVLLAPKMVFWPNVATHVFVDTPIASERIHEMSWRRNMSAIFSYSSHFLVSQCLPLCVSLFIINVNW